MTKEFFTVIKERKDGQGFDVHFMDHNDYCHNRKTFKSLETAERKSDAWNNQ